MPKPASNNALVIQRRMTTNADTPTLNQSSKLPQATIPQKQSSFGQVVYESNRK